MTSDDTHLPSAPYILFRDDFAGSEVLFERPRKTIVAEKVEEFFPALEAAQNAHDAGKWLAGYFSYEAGYLLEPKLRPIIPMDRRTPLMTLGVF
nr:aminodeoxychorismate synthase component I [Pseudomonadota bacterium]